MRLLLYRWGNQAERGRIMCHVAVRSRATWEALQGPKLLITILCCSLVIASNYWLSVMVFLLENIRVTPMSPMGKLDREAVSSYERLHSVECLIMWKSEIIASLHFFCLNFVWNFACGWVEMVSLPFRLWLTSLKSEAFGWTVHRLYPMAGTFLNIERVMEINTVSLS